jgi:ubiquinone/menaquinone biosynthesis C-methylase UbiE
MAAHYDSYDYPGYWKGREYEHRAEVHAIRSFLSRIKNITTALEIGAGYGRLLPSYAHRCRKIILTDPSSKLLAYAKQKFQSKKNIAYVQTTIENLPNKVRANSTDLIVMVRVMHHLEDPNAAFGVVNKILRKNGYFIFEFANKQHFKAQVSEFFKGNFTFPLDIFPKEVKGRRHRENVLPFLNYHPDIIRNYLVKSGFSVIEKRSVSNIRSQFIKKHLSTSTLVSISKLLQTPLSAVNFGPSIFILAQKR